MTTLLTVLERRLEELACYDASCAPPPVGTGGSKPGGKSGGSASSLPNGVDLTKYRQARRGEEASGLTDDILFMGEQIGKDIRSKLVSGEAQLKIRLPEDLIKSVIADGHIRSQHDTGTSGGLLDPDYRYSLENDMFGVPGTNPVYGYLGVNGKYNGYVNGYGQFTAVLKPEVQDRTSMTLGDSMSEDTPPAPVGLKEIKTLKSGPLGEAMILSSPDKRVDVLEESVSEGWVGTHMYYETQIHGGVSLAKDVSHFEIRASAEPFVKDQVKALEDAGFRVDRVDAKDREEYSLVAAYRRRVEELACHDKSCAPPPVGTGGSKSGPAKGKLSPTESGRVRPEMTNPSWNATIRAYGGQKAFEKRIGEMFSDVDLGTDREGRRVRVQIDRISDYGQDVYVQGSFIAGDAVNVGKFSRNIGTSDDGQYLQVDHSILTLKDNHQGLGIAQKFNDHALKGYEELGVDRILVDASLSKGPFAWARQGYRIDESRQNRHDWVDDQIFDMKASVDKAERDGVVSSEQAVEMKKRLTDLKNASNKGADVQPIHIASVGEGDPVWTDAKGSWLGKNQLIGESAEDRRHRRFSGVYYLGREAALTSALERRLEELACHDKSCAPPPVGTGGSKSSTGRKGKNQVDLGQLSGAATKARTLDLMIQASNLANEWNDAKVEGNKRKAWAKRDEFDKVHEELIRSRVNSMSVTTNGGRKFNVHMDDDVDWDMKLVQASVNRYADLLDEYRVQPVSIGFGPRAVAVGWAEQPNAEGYGMTTNLTYGMTLNHAGQANGSVWASKSREAFVMSIDESTVGKARIDQWSVEAFNPRLQELDDVGRAEYAVTHETGHLLHFQEINKRLRGGETEDEVNASYNIEQTFWEGANYDDLRLPSLGDYAYTMPTEFAAESFAVDYYGWDDKSGVPLDSMLGWAYDQRRP